MANPAVDQIRQNLARARQRVAEIESGARGQRPPEDWRQATNGTLPAHARAFESQLNAQRVAVAQFERELVYALLPTWGAANVLAAMGEK